MIGFGTYVAVFGVVQCNEIAQAFQLKRVLAAAEEVAFTTLIYKLAN